jgi:hypothetical protein
MTYQNFATRGVLSPTSIVAVSNNTDVTRIIGRVILAPALKKEQLYEVRATFCPQISGQKRRPELKYAAKKGLKDSDLTVHEQL